MVWIIGPSCVVYPSLQSSLGCLQKGLLYIVMPTKYKCSRSSVTRVCELIVLVYLYEIIPNSRDFNLLNVFHDIELPILKRI